MARDAQGRYWYQNIEGWCGPESCDSGITIGAQPGAPGAYIGGAPHTGSLDSFIERAIPLAIAAVGTWVVSLAAEPKVTASFASGAQAAARESALETPVRTEPMWEDEEIWEGDFGGGTDFGGWETGAGGADIDLGNLGSIIGGGSMVPTSIGGIIRGAAGGGVVGSMAAGAATLGGRLASMFGRGSGTFVINGIKGSMNSLWPLVRKYGPTSVAAALGIGAASLAELLMRAPTNPRKRARGISARDLRTTARVGRFNKRVNRLFGTGRGRTRSRPWRGGGRHYH